MNEFARVRPRDVLGSKRAAVPSSARNEYTPFQIIVRAGTGGRKRVNAVAGRMVSKRDHTIPEDRITLCRAHYIEVRRRTGWYPDALILFLDSRTGKPPAPIVAAPFDTAPNSNQPLWVDVLTPHDATPGEYTGAITSSAEGRPHRVPIELTVWDFRLSETPSMRSLDRPLTYQYNMEGSLLYPGVNAGVQGFITSIRLKLIREGLQDEDYEYLTILAQRRSRAVAEAVVKKIARSWHDWNTDARHLLHARGDCQIDVAEVTCDEFHTRLDAVNSRLGNIRGPHY
jgi:hypothetical protein